MEDLKSIIEGLLFVAEGPLTVDRARRVLPDADPGDIRAALADLFDEYQGRKGGFYVKEVAGGYQFRTRPEYNVHIRRMLRPNAPRLSRAALETLAIVAYKQPVIRSDIEHIRGVDCGGVLRMLMERKLIRILGRKEIPGRPLIYATTRLFLEVFDLKDLKDLPTPKEIEAMAQMPLEYPEPESGPDSAGLSDDPDALSDAPEASDPEGSDLPAVPDPDASDPPAEYE